jgi:uracil-DNA glycosylase family 4
MIQDLPYFRDLEKVETLIIGEAPGKASDEGSLGYVFGWNEWKTPKSRTNRNYRNFFFSLLKMNPETTYITDGVKCYTAKTDFKSVFKNCHVYLEQEISIIRPQKIILISKQASLKRFLEKNKFKYNFELLQIPHPSNQNLSKIKTVAEIFKMVGETSNNNEWVTIGRSIEREYGNLRAELKED